MRAAWTAFAIASLFFLFEFVARVQPSLDTTAIAGFFGLSNAGFGTLSSLFFWIYAPMQIIVGLLLDRYGARRFILTGSLACAGGVLVFASTNTVGIAAAGRALTGFGASFAFVGALWLVNHWFAPGRFALLSGAVNAVGMFGTAAGTVILSGMIADHGWRPIFLATGAFGLGIFILALLFLREPASTATTRESGAGEHVRDSLSAVLGDSRVWAIAMAGMLFYMPVNVYGGLWGTTELVHDHHLRAVDAETAVSMVFWGMALGSIAGGWISDAIGHRKYLVLGGALLTGLCYALVLALPVTTAMASTLLLGAGFFGGFQMLTFTMAKEGQPNALTGTVVAFVNMVGIGGALVFQPLVGWLADRSDGNFALALATMPACAVLAALIMIFVPEYRHPEHRPGVRKSGISAKTG